MYDLHFTDTFSEPELLISANTISALKEYAINHSKLNNIPASSYTYTPRYPTAMLFNATERKKIDKRNQHHQLMLALSNDT